MSFAHAEIAELWQSHYRQALERLGVEPGQGIDAVVVQAGGHPRASRAADAMTRQTVGPEAWRAYRNELRRGDHREFPRQVGGRRRGRRSASWS